MNSKLVTVLLQNQCLLLSHTVYSDEGFLDFGVCVCVCVCVCVWGGISVLFLSKPAKLPFHIMITVEYLYRKVFVFND